VRQASSQSHQQSNREIEATPDALTELRMQQAKDDRDRAVSECRTIADREKAQLSVRERAEYESQAQQEHDRATLIMILTTSLPR
jgi:hypothetical protein